MTEEKDWLEVTLPALVYIDECERAGTRASSADVVEHLRLEPEPVLRELRNLMEDGLISGVEATATQESLFLLDIRLLPDARRALRHWPRTFDATDLLASIDSAIRAASGSDRTKLERLREAAGNVGQTALSGVISAAASGVI